MRLSKGMRALILQLEHLPVRALARPLLASARLVLLAPSAYYNTNEQYSQNITNPLLPY